ncbi:BCCT family transporter [Sphingomonas sp. H160509]|uniref:BCCT family transporter n=1 Tax=Sphingomonas sp. H160509 TaxID=2955313 RepID=UPI0031592A91
MTVFGNTAISLDLGAAAGGIADAVQADLSTALFKFLEYLPAAGVTSTLAIALVAIFFITSADSGALVIDTLASGGLRRRRAGSGSIGACYSASRPHCCWWRGAWRAASRDAARSAALLLHHVNAGDRSGAPDQRRPGRHNACGRRARS